MVRFWICFEAGAHRLAGGWIQGLTEEAESSGYEQVGDKATMCCAGILFEGNISLNSNCGHHASFQLLVSKKKDFSFKTPGFRQPLHPALPGAKVIYLTLMVRSSIRSFTGTAAATTTSPSHVRKPLGAQGHP